LGSTNSRESTQKFPSFLDQHKIYYTNSNLNQKLLKKKKKNAAASGRKSTRRPAHSCTAHAGAARAAGRVPFVRPRPLPSLCGTLTGVPHPSAPSLPRTAARPRLRPPLARVLAHAHVRTSTASPSRTDCYHSLALYRLLSTSTASLADGRHDRPRTGR